MFQEKEKMEYFSQKTSDELKNRTWSSIQQEKKKLAKQRRQGAYLAACITGVLFVSNMMYQNSTIVKVNDVPISYLNVNVGNEDTDVPFTISECRNKEIQSEIPMEINISGNAHIEVSEGYIRRQETSEDSNEKVTQLDIEGKTVILWNMAEDMNPIATCTITTEETRYQYVLEMKESSWKLRLKEKN